MSFFRYPGGKAKLSDKIVSKLLKLIDSDTEYREPFFGGGSIGAKVFHVSRSLKDIWINDKDVGIACLWTALIKYPEDLKKRIRSFVPSTEAFYDFKKELLVVNFDDNKDFIVDKGFKKIAIHQISYSGLGTKSGSPLGGKEQGSEYTVDCRWSPEYICKGIDRIGYILKHFNIRFNRCSGEDFSELFCTDTKAVIYLDPPYFVKGNELYQHGFNLSDHERLSSLLKSTEHKWLLSYDDCKEVRKLYDWAVIDDVIVNYTINGSNNKRELLIYPKSLVGVFQDELELLQQTFEGANE